MAIQISMDICVLVFKDLYKEYLNSLSVTTEDAVRFTASRDNNLIKIGNVKHNGVDYTVCVINKEDMSHDYLTLSDFTFNTRISSDSSDNFDITIEKDLKLVRSRETPSGFNLSEYFNGEITEDMSHYVFFSDIVDLLEENIYTSVTILLDYLRGMTNRHLRSVADRLQNELAEQSTQS
jgi:hypothetical protein|nr:MAG TPA: hypothetical protein [Caudoviricetes sp.]